MIILKIYFMGALKFDTERAMLKPLLQLRDWFLGTRLKCYVIQVDLNEAILVFRTELLLLMWTSTLCHQEDQSEKKFNASK